MPDPINYCPSVLYSVPEEPEFASIDPEAATSRGPGSGGGGRPGAELQGRGGSGAGEAKQPGPSCTTPALAAVASCGAILTTQGVAALVTGASCLAALSVLDDCLARHRAAAK